MSIRPKKVTKDTANDFLWVEKYRPQTIDECILPQRLTSIFKDMVSRGDISNLLLSGSPGVGKTTIAKALCNELNMDSIIINASKDGNIDTLRTTIQDFASQSSFNGNMRCVVLDEANFLNAKSTQPALQNFIEEMHHSCRFIFTSNYPKQIIAPLHSRLSHISFDYDRSDLSSVKLNFSKRILWILKEEKIIAKPESIMALVKKHSPDLRKVINVIQGSISDGELDSGIIKTEKTEFSMLADIISTHKFSAVRDWVEKNPHVRVSSLMGLIPYLIPLVKKAGVPDIFTIMNQFDVREHMASDKSIHITALFVELIFSLEYR